MGYIPEGHNIFLERCCWSEDGEKNQWRESCYHLEPEPGHTEEVYTKLRFDPHLKVWKREELPEHYHYGNNARIPEIIVGGRQRVGSGNKAKAQGTGQKEGQKAQGTSK